MSVSESKTNMPNQVRVKRETVGLVLLLTSGHMQVELWLKLHIRIQKAHAPGQQGLMVTLVFNFANILHHLV